MAISMQSNLRIIRQVLKMQSTLQPLMPFGPQQKSALENSIAELVMKARSENMSWKLIGQILGTSGEAARQRYGSIAKRKPKRTA
jgi:hypothetical protein